MTSMTTPWASLVLPIPYPKNHASHSLLSLPFQAGFVHRLPEVCSYMMVGVTGQPGPKTRAGTDGRDEAATAAASANPWHYDSRARLVPCSFDFESH